MKIYASDPRNADMKALQGISGTGTNKTDCVITLRIASGRCQSAVCKKKDRVSPGQPDVSTEPLRKMIVAHEGRLETPHASPVGVVK
jgi:hypothetical protein